MAGNQQPAPGQGWSGLARFILKRRLNWLLVFVPISLAVALLDPSRLLLFATSALAIIPLAALIGRSTEQIAIRAGPGLGGFLNATFGNAAELIISLFALRQGLQAVVKATLTGSFIGNILLALGLSMLIGGWNMPRQVFSRTRAGVNATLLFLAVAAVFMPALFDLAVSGQLAPVGPSVYEFSILGALVLLATYLASLVFDLRTNRALIASVAFEPQETELTTRQAVGLLLAATAVTAIEAELLVRGISAVTEVLHLTQFFVGVILVAIVGNAAEYYSAITMARRNNMEVTMGIAAGSATQIALFVGPVLILVSFLFGQPMSAVFTPFEIVGATFAALAFAIVALDGESNWFEGVELIAFYAVLAIIFYFVPAG